MDGQITNATLNAETFEFPKKCSVFRQQTRTGNSVDFSLSVIGVLMSRPMIGLSRQMIFCL